MNRLNAPVPVQREIYATKRGVWCVKLHSVEWIANSGKLTQSLGKDISESACLGRDSSLLVLTNRGLFRFSYNDGGLSRRVLFGETTAAQEEAKKLMMVIGELKDDVWLWGTEQLIRVSSGKIRQKVPLGILFTNEGGMPNAMAKSLPPYPFYGDRVGNTLYIAVACSKWPHEVQYLMLSPSDETWHKSSEQFENPYPLVFWRGGLYRLPDVSSLKSLSGVVSKPSKTSPVQSNRNLFANLGDGRFLIRIRPSRHQLAYVASYDLAAKKRMITYSVGSSGIIQLFVEGPRFYYWPLGLSCDDVQSRVLGPCPGDRLTRILQ